MSSDKTMEHKVAPATPPVQAPAPSGDEEKTIEYKLLEGKVIAALSSIYDPEIPVNIYELGLIYGIAIDAERNVAIRMTLTAPACPVAGTLPGEVEKKVEEIPEVKKATVELVWEPPWSRDMMSESALLQLGMY
jgi:FeS assembly SUF system protein